MPSDLHGLSGNPFADGRDPRHLHPGRSHLEAVAHLRRAVEGGEPFALLTGLPGVGKTAAVEAAFAGAGPHVRVTVAASPALGREDFLARVIAGFPPAAGATGTGDGLEARLRAVADAGRAAVLVVEDAHALDVALLADLSLYSNLEADGRPLLRIVLVGRPELEETLATPACDALRRRIGAGCRLEPMSGTESAAYVRHLVAAVGGDGQALFGDDACTALHHLAHGIPGEIDRLAAEALALATTAGEERVAAGHVDFAVMMLGFRSAAGVAPAPARETAEPSCADAAAPVEAPCPVVAEAPAPGPDEPRAAAFEAPAEVTATAVESTVESPEVEAAEAPVEVVTTAAAPAIESPVLEVETVPSAVEVDVTPAYIRSGGQPHAAEVDVTPRPEARASRRGPRAKRAPGRGRVPAAALSAAALVVVAVAAFALVNSTRSRVRPAPGTEAVAVESAPVARPAPAPVARPAVEPVARPAVTTAAAPATPPPAPAERQRRYGVAVATFLSESRAQAECDRLAAALQRPCHVQPDEESFTVVVGPATGSREAASLSADLAQRGLVSEARVVRWSAGQ